MSSVATHVFGTGNIMSTGTGLHALATAPRLSSAQCFLRLADRSPFMLV